MGVACLVARGLVPADLRAFFEAALVAGFREALRAGLREGRCGAGAELVGGTPRQWRRVECRRVAVTTRGRPEVVRRFFRFDIRFLSATRTFGHRPGKGPALARLSVLWSKMPGEQ